MRWRGGGGRCRLWVRDDIGRDGVLLLFRGEEEER